MSKQSKDSHASHSSSIALLQERFKRLQKAKEMREEKELSKKLTESQLVDSNNPSRLFFHSELIVPPRPPLQASSPSTQSKNADFRAIHENPTWENLQLHRPTNFEDSDIDTSLRL
ncbi:hypothetical protein HYC85_015094 [Camellia sinensis]|uniref:Uncharacterized protein n=1 Tax=Camellia sinensis TaxID=4442 RepID=A0A7J7H9C7_CAMSI|nr:hypothetical protein HYC85_015094 [Camellia sinensis]